MKKIIFVKDTKYSKTALKGKHWVITYNNTQIVLSLLLLIADTGAILAITGTIKLFL